MNKITVFRSDVSDAEADNIEWKSSQRFRDLVNNNNCSLYLVCTRDHKEHIHCGPELKAGLLYGCEPYGTTSDQMRVFAGKESIGEICFLEHKIKNSDDFYVSNTYELLLPFVTGVAEVERLYSLAKENKDKLEMIVFAQNRILDYHEVVTIHCWSRHELPKGSVLRMNFIKPLCNEGYTYPAFSDKKGGIMMISCIVTECSYSIVSGKYLVSAEIPKDPLGGYTPDVFGSSFKLREKIIGKALYMN